MRSDLAIQVENLGKSYTIGHKKTAGARADTMRDAVAAAGSNFARTLGAMLRGQPIYDADQLEEFWALQDVSFDIRQGEAVGIIGRNGAGKSTLLKVLSRITEPSRGRVRLRGRVASLLEVGTGFHPELSGRENIFLNGAILGMSRAEVQRKFDEIIDFAGVERFLDTPVKRYSSGMYVRLAFAVAAHLEPEILVVDEVLAVGDAEFQKKCLGKMNDVASHGRTVLFVSHNISAISALCEKGIFLRDGKVNFVGPIAGAISAYLDRGSEHAWVAEQIGGSELFLTKAQIVDVKVGTETVISVDIEIESKFDQSCAIEFLIKDQIMTPVAFTTTGFSPVTGQFSFATGNNSLRLKVCLPQLALGRYHASIVLSRPVSIFLDRREDILTFTVDHHESGSRAQVFDQEWGCGCFSGFIETTAIA